VLPISAHAQQSLKIWRIGVLESATRELNTPNMNVFLKTLREYGYIEGENLVIISVHRRAQPALAPAHVRIDTPQGEPDAGQGNARDSSREEGHEYDPGGYGCGRRSSRPRRCRFALSSGRQYNRHGCLYDRGGDKATWHIEGASARNEADGVFRRFQELCGPEPMERSGIGGQALELACQPIGYTKCS